MTTTTARPSMWQGRMNGGTDPIFAQINDSLSIDAQLVQEDVEGSIAWAATLREAGVLDEAEMESIQEALRNIAHAANDQPQRILESGLEDIHTWVEHELTARLGELGKKIHTGRSRNDQVATDLRLWTMKAIEQRRGEIHSLQQALVALGRREEATVVPGYTHLQRAQPVLFAHWCLAYYDMLARDSERLRDAGRRTSMCPLGAGALSGTAYPINRAALARALGFAGPTTNSLDAVSDRDFVVETLSAIALCAVHLSRLAEDLIFYGSSEAGFVEFDDAVSSGSSMMPQKKNPDGLELVRGKTGGAIGALVSICVTLKGLPLSYNKDLQEDKAPLFQAMENLSLSLRIVTRTIETLRVNRNCTRTAAAGAYANATELADYLVTKGVPFRDAHVMAGRIVQRAIARGVSLKDMPISEMEAIAPQVEPQVRVHLTIDAALRKRDVLGGTAPRRVHEALAQAETPRSRAQDIEVVAARVDHLDEICQLVDHWAARGENLPRSREEILSALADFGVALHNGRVVGCGSLYLYSPGLAEIRSLGVEPRMHGHGIGSRLVHHFLDHAKQMHIPRVFVLTREPRFFEKLEFAAAAMDLLPEKVFKDCLRCAKRSQCDEIPMIHELST